MQALLPKGLGCVGDAQKFNIWLRMQSYFDQVAGGRGPIGISVLGLRLLSTALDLSKAQANVILKSLVTPS